MQSQAVLFAQATEQERERTKFLLSKYTSMLALMTDFEQFERELKQVAIDGEVAKRLNAEEMYADKTANAVILMDKQRWVYHQYAFYTLHLRRAYLLIADVDARQAIDCRYMQGRTYKMTVIHFRHSLSESTIRRKLAEGIASMADALKLFGVFEQDKMVF